jgi:hypothetical protein
MTYTGHYDIEFLCIDSNGKQFELKFLKGLPAFGDVGFPGEGNGSTFDIHDVEVNGVVTKKRYIVSHSSWRHVINHEKRTKTTIRTLHCTGPHEVPESA